MGNGANNRSVARHRTAANSSLVRKSVLAARRSGAYKEDHAERVEHKPRARGRTTPACLRDSHLQLARIDLRAVEPGNGLAASAYVRCLLRAVCILPNRSISVLRPRFVLALLFKGLGPDGEAPRHSRDLGLLGVFGCP